MLLVVETLLLFEAPASSSSFVYNCSTSSAVALKRIAMDGTDVVADLPITYHLLQKRIFLCLLIKCINNNYKKQAFEGHIKLAYCLPFNNPRGILLPVFLLCIVFYCFCYNCFNISSYAG